MQTLFLYWLLFGATFSSLGSFVLPQEMSALNIENVHIQLSQMDKTEKKKAYQQLAAQPDSPMVRFAKNYLMMLRGAVFEGKRAESVLWEMVTDYLGRPGSSSKSIAAVLLLSIGRGQLARQQFRAAEATLKKVIAEMRKLQDEDGLARALWTYSNLLVSHSHHPWDALDSINELSVIADRMGSARHSQEAKSLLRTWRLRMNQVDDYFGRASSRLQYFESALGVPKDADLIAQEQDVLLMSPDTDDQLSSSPFRYTTFDGLFFRTLALPDETLGLRGSVVARDGTLWAATNRGLFHYDGQEFTQFVNPDLDDEENNDLHQKIAQKPAWTRKSVQLPSNVCNEVKQGSQGLLYVASNEGLFTFDANTHKVEKIPIDNAEVPRLLERVAPFAHNGLVVAWIGGFAVRSDKNSNWVSRKFAFDSLDTPKAPRLFGLLTDRLGNPWVHGTGGALKLHQDQIERVVDQRFNVVTSSVNHVLNATDGAYWFATPDGICRQSGSYCAVLNAKRWLPAEWALDLFEWPANHIWSSFYLGGLARLDPPHYQHFDARDGLVQPINIELLVLGGLFYMVNNLGLTRLDPESAQIDNFISGVEGIPSPLGITVIARVLQSDEMVIAAQNVSQRKQLIIFDGSSSVILGQKDGMPDEPIQSFCEAQPGVLLFATDSGVYSLDMLSTSIKRETVYDSIVFENIRQMVCWPERSVWIGTASNKLYQVEDDQIVELTRQQIGLANNYEQLLLKPNLGLFVIGKEQALRNQNGSWATLPLPKSFALPVYDVEQDDDKRLFFSTESGVFVTDGESWVRLGVADGLISDVAFGMEFRAGHMWISGKGGITKWRWPEQEPPETLLVVDDSVFYTDKDGQSKKMRLSKGEPEKGYEKLRSSAGVFEVASAELGRFWPPQKPVSGNTQGESHQNACDDKVNTTGELKIGVGAIDPYMDDLPEEFFYYYRVDDAAWQPATTSNIHLTDLEDGLHRVDLRATDRRLNRDPTLATYCFRVEKPIGLWAYASCALLLVVLVLITRRRLAWYYQRFTHRNFVPIKPNPFLAERPALGDSFFGREDKIRAIEQLIEIGGAAVVLGREGSGKHSFMQRLKSHLEGDNHFILSFDLAQSARGGDISTLVQNLNTALTNRLADKGELDALRLDDFGTADSMELSGSHDSSSGPERLSSVSSVSHEDNAFFTFGKLIRLLEYYDERYRIVVLLDNAEQLGLDLDEDHNGGSYLFPFLRSLVQQRSNTTFVLSLEGRQAELRKRFEQLFAFANPVVLDPLSQTDTLRLLSAAFSTRVVINEVSSRRIIALSGCYPNLVQKLGSQLVEQLNQNMTNVVELNLIDEAASELVSKGSLWFQNLWQDLSREERLVLIALSGRSAPSNVEDLVTHLGSQKCRMLIQEVKRACLSLKQDSVVFSSKAEDASFGLVSELLSQWIQRNYTIHSVLEESQDYISHYQLLNCLGEGGMGVVFKARDMINGNMVAIKLLKKQLMEHKRSRRRFLRESKLGKRLNHPNIIKILDYGHQAGRMFLAMEFVHGLTLSQWLRQRGSLAPKTVAELGKHLTSALTAIHEIGIIHRDLKSDNILIPVEDESENENVRLDPSLIKIMDFGLAKGNEATKMTRVGSILGTIAYMSPEQARGEVVDPRSDLYSLGVILFESLMGEAPFVGSETAVLHSVIHQEAPKLSQLRPDSPRLADLIDRILVKDPSARPSSAAWLNERFCQMLAEESLQSYSSSIIIKPLLQDAESHTSFQSRTIEVLRSSVLLSSLDTFDSQSELESALRVTGGDKSKLIYRVSAQVAQGSTDQEQLSQALAQCKNILGGKVGLVMLPRENDQPVLLPKDNPCSDSIIDLTKRCIEERSGILVNGFEDTQDDVVSLVCVPLWAGQKILGAMSLGRQSQLPAFDDDDLELLACVGYLLGLGLERERLFRQVIEQERMVAAGQMLAGVAHDLRNPMAVISGFTTHIEKNSEFKEECDIILSQVQHMNDMIQDLLAYSRGERKLFPQPVDLQKLGDHIRLMLDRQVRSQNTELKIDVGPGGSVWLDEAKLKRILLNLAKNALEALRKKGQLTIVFALGDDGLRIMVSDNGPGIPERARSNLFDPFVTVGKKGGTGLGLAVVKRFVEDHQGTIALDSAPGQGTTFSIWLPAQVPSEESEENEENPTILNANSPTA